MTALLLKDLPHYTDILRLRNGASLTVRFVQPRDAEALQNYFRGLTARSRYNRLLGAAIELPQSVLSQFVRVGEGEGFSAVATMMLDGVETIVGEIRYAFDVQASRLEFGISIADRWHRDLRRYAARQRRHDPARTQVRLCLHAGARRLEAGALRKEHRDRARRDSLRELAYRRARGGAARGVRAAQHALILFVD